MATPRQTAVPRLPMTFKLQDRLDGHGSIAIQLMHAGTVFFRTAPAWALHDCTQRLVKHFNGVHLITAGLKATVT